MKTIDEWLKLYARDHKNKTNQIIHKVCVPLIVLSLLGILYNFKIPQLPNFNFAHILILISLIFYFILDKIFFILMLIQSVIMLTILNQASSQLHLLYTSVIIFVIAWIGQFIGHKIEGQKPSFFEDIQFLLIGPLWVVKGLRSKIKNAIS